MRAVLVRDALRAMGTDVELLVEADDAVAADAALTAARAEIARLEALMSRFRPESALSRLNAAGRAVLDPDTFAVVAAAVRARSATGGRFDPTVHDAVVRAGYDRDHAAIPVDGPAPTRDAVPAGGAVTLDPATRSVALASGVRLDLGGIAKGYAADRACALLAAAGPALVSAGGDMAVSGPRRDGGPWTVAVGDDGLTLALSAGGLATSGTDRRTWRRGGRRVHHVIDPATGRPAETDLVRVTAVAASAALAEVAATDLLLLGRDTAVVRAAAEQIPAVLVPSAGPPVLAGPLRDAVPSPAERCAA